MGKKPLGYCIVAITMLALAGSGQNARNHRETSAQVEREILRLDDGKVKALNANNATWFERNYASDIVITGLGYGGVVNKAAVVNGFRSGAHRLQPGSVHHDNRRIHVYNGDTAVLTYIGNGRAEHAGKLSTVHTWTTDVYVKQGGVWREVIHDVTAIPDSRNSIIHK